MNALEPGSTLGGYRILARLRAGAMGVFGRMFTDEAKLSARIDDPNVVRVEEFGQSATPPGPTPVTPVVTAPADPVEELEPAPPTARPPPRPRPGAGR